MGNLRQEHGLEPELRELPPRNVICARSRYDTEDAIINGIWLVTLVAYSLWFLYRIYMRGVRGLPLGEWLTPLLFCLSCLAYVFLKALSFDHRINGMQRTSDLMRHGLALTAIVLRVCDRRDVAYWMKWSAHLDGALEQDSNGINASQDENDGRHDVEGEPLEHSEALENEICVKLDSLPLEQRAELWDNAGAQPRPDAVPRSNPPRSPATGQQVEQFLRSGERDSPRSLVQGHTDDAQPLPCEDHWGATPAWDTSTKSFAIYRFVATDSQVVLGCLKADGSSSSDCLQRGDRLSVLCDPHCPDRHLVYKLIYQLKIVPDGRKEATSRRILDGKPSAHG
jgi:hypothetical protein